MVLLDLDQFLLRVGRLYKSKKAGGSVWLTFKRISSDAKGRKGRKNAKKLSGDGEGVLLARATDGAKVKLSCEVSAKDHIKFQIAISDMLKLELDALKKR
jgi:signal recognition particle subunit SRP14|eukprot:COSAG02_NODE_1247_length_13644_cov_17.519675_5_plen_100_part_00